MNVVFPCRAAVSIRYGTCFCASPGRYRKPEVHAVLKFNRKQKRTWATRAQLQMGKAVESGHG